MALYRYVKAPPRTRPRKKYPVVASIFLMTMGTGLLLWVGWPIISFTILREGLLVRTVTPVSDASAPIGGRVRNSTVLSPVVLAASENQASPVIDFTNANAWFPSIPQKKVVTPVNSYRISIPKLKVSNAVALIGGDDLSKTLIHYGGTGLPGEYGNAIVFGHSTLPQFFNQSDYKTIFSTLPTIKEGDEVFVEYDGITYTYAVYEMYVTSPTDLSSLEQKFDDSYLTLVTCVPPGTYWKRLYVKTRLVRPV